MNRRIANTASTHRPRSPLRLKPAEPFGTAGQCTEPDNASTALANNTERVLWAAHQRAAELVKTEPGVVWRTIFTAVQAKWRGAFLGADDAALDATGGREFPPTPLHEVK